MKGKVEDGQAAGRISINNVDEDCIIDTGAAVTVTNMNKAERLKLKDIKITKIFLTVGGAIEVRYHVASHVKFGEYEKTNKIIGCYVPTGDYEKEIKRRERRPIETMVGMDILREGTLTVTKGGTWELAFNH